MAICQRHRASHWACHGEIGTHFGKRLTFWISGIKLYTLNRKVLNFEKGLEDGKVWGEERYDCFETCNVKNNPDIHTKSTKSRVLIQTDHGFTINRCFVLSLGDHQKSGDWIETIWNDLPMPRHKYKASYFSRILTSLTWVKITTGTLW